MTNKQLIEKTSETVEILNGWVQSAESNKTIEKLIDFINRLEKMETNNLFGSTLRQALWGA